MNKRKSWKDFWKSKSSSSSSFLFVVCGLIYPVVRCKQSAKKLAPGAQSVPTSRWICLL